MADDYFYISRQLLDDLYRVIREVNNLPGNPAGGKLPSPPARPQPARDNIFPAKITGTSGDGYTWKEQDAHDDGSFDDTTNGRTDTKCDIAYEMNGAGVPTDSIVWIHIRADVENQSTSYTFTYGGQIFMVKVSNDGGSAGNKTTVCSFTYTAKDFSGTTLATGLAPVFSTRGTKGAMVAASINSYATAFYDGPDLKLLQTTEVAVKGGC